MKSELKTKKNSPYCLMSHFLTQSVFLSSESGSSVESLKLSKETSSFDR